MTSGRIVDDTIKSNDIAAGGVTTANIANRAVSFGKLSTGNGANSYGVPFACLVDGNGAAAACFDEAETFNPTKPSPVAIVQAVCLGAESTDGTPWDPTPAGLAPLCDCADAVEAQAAWHNAQHDALEARAAELRAKRDAHRAWLLD